jgi:hypothetical protein
LRSAVAGQNNLGTVRNATSLSNYRRPVEARSAPESDARTLRAPMPHNVSTRACSLAPFRARGIAEIANGKRWRMVVSSSNASMSHF